MNKIFATLAVLLLLFCVREAAAQPTCFVNYEISFPCHYPPGDIIFEGRVLSLKDLRLDEPEGSRQAQELFRSGYLRGKAVIVVDTLFKGELTGEVELAFNSRCWGTIAEGKKYIFNVRKTTEGLFADRWSSELDTLREDDIEHYISMYRSFLKGERQPRLFGTLRHWSSAYPYQAGEPIPNVTVEALKSGARFETRTDENGRYEFRELPDGEYQVYPLLPESLRPPDDDYTKLPRERHKETASVTNQILCGARRDFLAWDNGVIAGRVEDADGNPVRVSTKFGRNGRRGEDADGRPMKWFQIGLLWLIDENVRQYAQLPANQVGDLHAGRFAFVNLLPGPYRLEFYCGDGPGEQQTFLTYPSSEPGKTGGQVIDLAPGQKVRDLVIRLPFPSKK